MKSWRVIFEIHIDLELQQGRFKESNIDQLTALGLDSNTEVSNPNQIPD